MRPIDADALKEQFREGAYTVKGIREEIDNAPTVEPVKQCKFCKHCGDEDYCSDCHSDYSLFEYYQRPHGEWIPVSKRLPNEETDVLICNINGDVTVSRGSYSTEMKDEFIWYTSGWRFGKVIAWMPLPEPYKEAENE